MAPEEMRVLLDTATTVLTVVALILAILHLVEIRSQSRKAQEHTRALHQHTNALSEIQNALSTRYIGEFPAFCPDIVKLLERTKREITIVCDFPGYGSFTVPEVFLDYRQTLERKLVQENVRVSITCFNSLRRKSFHEQGLTGSGGWEKWRRSPEAAEQLRKYLRLHGRDSDFETLTADQFHEILEAADRRLLQDTFGRAEVHEIDSHVPTYFWLIDGMSAIFVFSSRSERALEYGFSTTDSKLISALEDLRARYNREGEANLAQARS